MALPQPIFMPNRIPTVPTGAVSGRTASFPLLENLMAYWSMDETSGDRADSHGSFDLTDNNTCGSIVGVQGNAVDFIAANGESLSHANGGGDFDNVTDITIAGWAIFDTVQVGEQYLIQRGNKNNFCRSNLSTTDFRFGVRTETGLHALNSDHSLVNGTWFHFIYWVNVTTKQCFVRVNDTSQAGLTYTGTVLTGSSFLLGAGLDGNWDEVGYWTRLLTTDEHTWLYNSGSGRTYADIAAYTG